MRGIFQRPEPVDLYFEGGLQSSLRQNSDLRKTKNKSKKITNSVTSQQSPPEGHEYIEIYGDTKPVLVPKKHQPLNRRYDKTNEDQIKIMEAEHQQFVRKTFAHFTLQVAILSAYVLTLKFQKNPEFAQDMTGLIIAIVTALVATVGVLFNIKWQRIMPLNYTFYLLHTAGLSYIAGYLACKTSMTVVLGSLTFTLVLAAVMGLFAGKMVIAIGKMKMMEAATPTFGMLGLIVVMAILFAVCTGQIKNGIFLGLGFMLMVFYFLTDTYMIVSAKYNKAVTKDDYIYGSIKLFSDFVLCFSLLVTYFTGDN